MTFKKSNFMKSINILADVSFKMWFIVVCTFNLAQLAEFSHPLTINIMGLLLMLIAGKWCFIDVFEKEVK